jgi:hypothetical protein
MVDMTSFQRANWPLFYPQVKPRSRAACHYAKYAHPKIHSIHLDDSVDTYDFAGYDGFTVRQELTGQGDWK